MVAISKDLISEIPPAVSHHGPHEGGWALSLPVNKKYREWCFSFHGQPLKPHPFFCGVSRLFCFGQRWLSLTRQWISSWYLTPKRVDRFVPPLLRPGWSTSVEAYVVWNIYKISKGSFEIYNHTTQCFLPRTNWHVLPHPPLFVVCVQSSNMKQRSRHLADFKRQPLTDAHTHTYLDTKRALQASRIQDTPGR